MDRKLINNQATNLTTYNMYITQLKMIAQNVFVFDNLPKTLNKRFINKTLLKRGSIAFFKDEYLGGLIALPFENKSMKLDVYDEPLQITVRSNSGYTRTLKQDEFVIMYDNDVRTNIIPFLLQYAERLSICMRTCDVNIAQQRTNRYWKTSNSGLNNLKNNLNMIDTFQETIITYKNLNQITESTACVEPAPYVADKIDLHYEKIWNEFLRFVGVSNLSYTKKERNIRDEINAMQGGTVISRLDRYSPRKEAVEKINELFGTDIEVKYYDGLPTTEKEVLEDDLSDFSDDSDGSDI